MEPSVFVPNPPHNMSISPVCDNGCGMTSSQKTRVFEPFITYKSGGTGLGLAVTRQIIEAHHGSVEIESAPGSGSTFHIYFLLNPAGRMRGARTAITNPAIIAANMSGIIHT